MAKVREFRHYFLSILCLMECGLRSNCCCKTGLPCFYDLSYGRRLDPNTKAFSAAYNDAVDIANKNRLTFLALEYAKNSENMRLQCVFSHFQRRKTGLSILQLQLKLFFLQFSKKKNGGVGPATTIKLHFLSLKSSKNRWNLGFQPVHNIMEDV